MCTVTALRRQDGWTVTMNRDERRTRSKGEPPSLWTEPRMLAPRDPEGGGTWIGVRSDGAWACLLNGYLGDGSEPAVEDPETRGRLIPQVLSASDPLTALREGDLARTLSFRLWVSADDVLRDLYWDGRTLRGTTVDAGNWAMVTSSSLRQEEIRASRRQVFERWRREGAEILPNGLPRLHTERMGLSEEDAIVMARSYSHTKSCTQIEIGVQQVEIRYWSEGFEGPPETTLAIRRS